MKESKQFHSICTSLRSIPKLALKSLHKWFQIFKYNLITHTYVYYYYNLCYCYLCWSYESKSLQPTLLTCCPFCIGGKNLVLSIDFFTDTCNRCLLLTKKRMRNVVHEFVRHGAITNIVFSNMAKVACYVVVGAVLCWVVMFENG